jgi:hypothetical protein
MEADAPQECLGITALDFNSFMFSTQLYMPSYMKWFLEKSDMLGTMRFHKRFLQYLQSGGVKAERWLLKTPVHLRRLPELFDVYPDAKIIMTHRGPADIVTSTASLISSVRTLYSDREDPKVTGKEQASLWSEYFKRFIESRRQLGKEGQFVDIRFEDFVADQTGVIREIYARFGWDLPESTVKKFKDFLQMNPRDKYGKHVYSIESFGLKEEKLNEQFSSYLEFYNTL